MLYNVFHFKSLKIALAKTGDDNYVGYAIDSKYPEFNRPIIRGSAKNVVEVCIYLYKARLRTAICCEGYEVPSECFDINDDVDVRDWVSYVLNRYLFGTFRVYYEYTYKKISYSYIPNDTTYSLYDWVYDGIAIKYWDSDEESW